MNYVVYLNGALKRNAPLLQKGDFSFDAETELPTFYTNIIDGALCDVFVYSSGKLTHRITYTASRTYATYPLNYSNKDVEYFVLGAFH